MFHVHCSCSLSSAYDVFLSSHHICSRQSGIICHVLAPFRPNNPLHLDQARKSQEKGKVHFPVRLPHLNRRLRWLFDTQHTHMFAPVSFRPILDFPAADVLSIMVQHHPPFSKIISEWSQRNLGVQIVNLCSSVLSHPKFSSLFSPSPCGWKFSHPPKHRSLYAFQAAGGPPFH